MALEEVVDELHKAGWTVVLHPKKSFMVTRGRGVSGQSYTRRVKAKEPLAEALQRFLSWLETEES